MSNFEAYFSQLYNFGEMNRTFNYWKQMKSIESVAKVKPEYDSIVENYRKEMEYLAEQNQNQYDEIESKYLRNKKLLSLWKKIAIGMSISTVVLFVIGNYKNIVFLFLCSILFFILAVVAGIVLFVVNLMETRSTNKYYSNMNNIKMRAEVIYEKYANKAQILYNKIDNLYLDSLDPVQRELILTKREIKDVNKQMLNMQKQMADENRRLSEQLYDAQNTIESMKKETSEAMANMKRETYETNETMKKMKKKFNLDSY